MSRPEFSVCQFFANDSYTYEERYVTPEQALATFRQLTGSVGAKIGTTKRVIITDGGDCINMEWEHGKGITYPAKEDM